MEEEEPNVSRDERRINHRKPEEEEDPAPAGICDQLDDSNVHRRRRQQKLVHVFPVPERRYLPTPLPSNDSSLAKMQISMMSRQNYLCKYCKRPRHFTKECPNDSVCNNCGQAGHMDADCNLKTMCWNC
ncbi:hypothetical protein Dimus_007316 [Dionaea muscipula]